MLTYPWPLKKTSTATKVTEAHRVSLTQGRSCKMETLVSLIGGKLETKAKYYLNDATTLKKLKKAADINDMTIIKNNQSNTINFST